MVAQSLLRFYPRAWRERYGEEFLATAGHDSLRMQQVIDIVSGAIDAWLSTDVRHATAVTPVEPGGGGSMTLKYLTMCERSGARYTKRDSLIGSGVMIVAGLILVVAGVAARRAGWSVTGDVLSSLAFPVSLTLSMPFWLMKGQPWKAQVVIVGGMLIFLTAIGYLSTLI